MLRDREGEGGQADVMEAPVKVRPPQASLSGGLLLSGGVPPRTPPGRDSEIV